MALYVAY